MRYYLYLYPTDMRRSFYTLSGMVTNQMGRTCRTGTFTYLSTQPPVYWSCQFVAIPKRWVVEKTFTWFKCYGRLS